ncbi:glycosyltransferase [Moorena sp. SIO4A5]|uniref:glycosyltransferase n=1 Tax=Moorena sp. SIO4A5 TaxID=2607838 RepID=UPI0013C7818B|nr:glycosyltransferase [Moorena sp. SIO4A5]NEO21117.1 glycosyltransferase [Moorena sp. SIO4A5]
MPSNRSKSELDYVIAPEIKDDDFYKAIQRIAREEDIKTVLEIRSSSGAGSTEAFVKGLRENPSNPVLFCMEVSQPRFAELKERYRQDSFVKCYNISSISLEQFPREYEVRKFYHSHRSPLNNYPLEQVLGLLRQDIDYVREMGTSGDGIETIKQENQIEDFDLVLIDGSKFTAQVELDQVYGSKFILLDNICTYKNYSNHHRLLRDKNYKLIEQNASVRNGYSIFAKADSPHSAEKSGEASTPLPINFFTIVINGEPFIRYHIDVFSKLPFRWHWHIIEGVAKLKHDTAWSLATGGYVSDEIHHNGRSIDGTTEYLDQLMERYPDQITVYRKPDGVFWEGKREMVNAPLENIQQECLLWQVDVDELWTTEQICKARQMFIDQPDKTAAFFWCWYFVGKNLIVSSRNCYTQNPKQEWLRVWRFQPGAVWATHEPPRLVQPSSTNQSNQSANHGQDVASINPFLHRETEAQGLVFQHFAYVTPEQLQFKESYYGYQNALAEWQGLQQQSEFPVFLRQHLSWVKDETLVEPADICGIVPIAQKEPDGEKWQFLQLEEFQQQTMKIEIPFPQIVVDGVFFQFFPNSGISQVWKSLLEEWATNGFADHVIVLDRAGTAPRIPGIRYRPIRAYDYNKTGADADLLQEICDEKGADLFISSYYTAPLSTPSVFMAYDMIPEVIGANLNEAGWKEKHYGILHASRYITISENTARDLIKFFPHISPSKVTVAHCGVKKVFSPASDDDINEFKTKFKVTKPYLLLVGERTGVNGYKNAIFLFRALSKLVDKEEFGVICVGGRPELEPELAALAEGITTMVLPLSDEELKVAYSGAIALVVPSLYEGFGLPVTEAMVCGCPVITCRHSSLPEAAGEAALYVDQSNVYELIDALYKVQNPEVRNPLIADGFEHAKKFSWSKMADTVVEVLVETAKTIKNDGTGLGSPLWGEFRKLQAQIQEQLPPSPSPIQVQPTQLPSGDLEQQLMYAEAQLQQKQRALQEAGSTLAAMESSKFWKLRVGWFRLKPLLVPVVSLILGINLLLLSTAMYADRTLVKLTSFVSPVQGNLFFSLGGSLLSIALMLGMVGYLGYMKPQVLRRVRIVMGSGGLALIGLTVLQNINLL